MSVEKSKFGNEHPYDFTLGLMIAVIGVIVLVVGVVTVTYCLGVIGFIDLIVGMMLIAQSDNRR